MCVYGLLSYYIYIYIERERDTYTRIHYLLATCSASSVALGPVALVDVARQEDGHASLCVYIYMYMCTSLSILYKCIKIHIYIYREREMYVYTYIYIYIHTAREREREMPRWWIALLSSGQPARTPVKVLSRMPLGGPCAIRTSGHGSASGMYIIYIYIYIYIYICVCFGCAASRNRWVSVCLLEP